MYRSGVFDNTQKYPVTNNKNDNNESNRNSQELLCNNNKINIQQHLNDTDCKMSPIITSSIKKIFNSQDDTPSTHSSGKISYESDNKANNLDNLNRNLNFDDTIDNDKNSQSQTKLFNTNSNNNKLETVEEDDELLAHVEKMESNNNTKLNDESLFEVGFKTAKGGNIAIKKESLMLREKLHQNENEDMTKTNSDSFIQVGFMTAKGSNIVVKKETIISIEKKIEQENFKLKDDIITCSSKATNSLTSSVVCNSNNVIFSGFQTATGKKISINEDILEKNIQKLYDEKSDDTFKIPLIIENKNMNDSINISNSTLNAKNMTMSVDFKTCSGKKIEVKQSSYEVNKKLLEPLKTDETTEKSDTSNSQLKIPSIVITQPKQINQSIIQPQTIKPPQNLTLNKKVLDGRHFKRPQLLDKSKMNRYVEEPSSNDKSMNNLNDTSLAVSISNLFENTNNKTTTSDEMEVTSNLINETNNSDNKIKYKKSIAYLDINSIEVTSFIQNESKKLVNEVMVEKTVPEKSYTFYKVKPIIKVVRTEWPRYFLRLFVYVSIINLFIIL